MADFALKHHCFTIRKHNFFMDIKCITLQCNLHIYSTSGLSFLMHGFITLSDVTSYDKEYEVQNLQAE